jgi:hypothetical protein
MSIITLARYAIVMYVLRCWTLRAPRDKRSRILITRVQVGEPSRKTTVMSQVPKRENKIRDVRGRNDRKPTGPFARVTYTTPIARAGEKVGQGGLEPWSPHVG